MDWLVSHWLWFIGPAVAVALYWLTDRRDTRREAEIERWRTRKHERRVTTREAAAYRDGKEVTTTVTKPRRGPPRVTAMPGPLTRMLATTGGGVRLDTFELVSKLAYLAIMGADATQGSDHATIVARLDEAGPTFTVRPLPIVEGERVPNTGVQFKKDPELMERFLVERTLDDGPPDPISDADAKAIRKWLSPPLREALLEFPDGWLRVDGKAKTMAYTLYGPADAARIDALIAAADIVFAEYGAEGGPSLVDDEEDDEPAAAPPPPAKKKAAASSGKSAR